MNNNDFKQHFINMLSAWDIEYYEKQYTITQTYEKDKVYNSYYSFNFFLTIFGVIAFEIFVMIAKHSAAIFQKRELKNNFRHEFAIIQERLSRIYDLDEWSFGVERIDEMEQNHSREGYTPSDYEHLGIPKDTSRCYLVYLYESAPFADNIMGY